MKLCLTTTNSKSEYVAIYGYRNSKWKKIESIRLTDETSLELDNLEYDKIKLRIMPKYISKIGWILLFAILGVIDLITTCFGSFSLSDKYYVDYELDKEEVLNLKYNGSNLFNNDEKIIGKAKGKYIAILFGLSSLTIFASIIAICIIFGIHPSAI